MLDYTYEGLHGRKIRLPVAWVAVAVTVVFTVMLVLPTMAGVRGTLERSCRPATRIGICADHASTTAPHPTPQPIQIVER